MFTYSFSSEVIYGALQRLIIIVCICSSVLWLVRGRDQTRDGGGHLSAELPVFPGTDPGLCGDGTSDLTGGWGPGSDVLCKPDVIRGLPVLLSLRGLPPAPP